MSQNVPDWQQEPDSQRPQKQTHKRPREEESVVQRAEGVEAWMNPGLSDREATANLDSQDPATLYYLGQVVDIPQVVQVYVEHRTDGERKHWAVIEQRDYEIMEDIYEIEEDTLERFPVADLSFRVTVYTESGPSVSESAVKIYDSR